MKRISINNFYIYRIHQASVKPSQVKLSEGKTSPFKTILSQTIKH